MSEEKENKLMVQFEIEGHEIKLTPAIVREYIVGDLNSKITNQEFKMFTELCKVRKLNPFLKEAYLIKFGEQPAQLIVGKDAILKRAIKNKNFNGRKQGVIVSCEKGDIVYRDGTFISKNEELVGGWAEVYRKDWEYPVKITVSFDEVAQRKRDGSYNSNWANKGATMVEKVALIRALREAFAEDVGGMVDENEVWEQKDMGNNSRTVDVEAEVIEQKEETTKKVEI